MTDTTPETEYFACPCGLSYPTLEALSEHRGGCVDGSAGWERERKLLLELGIYEMVPVPIPDDQYEALVSAIPGAVSVETTELHLTDFGREVQRYADDLRAEQLAQLDAAMLRVAALLDELGVEFVGWYEKWDPDFDDYGEGLVVKLRDVAAVYTYDPKTGTRP